MSDAQREALSAARKGIKFSEEHRAKISAANKGRKHTPEAKEKIAVAKRGKSRAPFSDEWRANIGAAAHKPRAKGPSPSYLAAHKRHLRWWDKTGACLSCDTPGPTEWAWLHPDRPGEYSDDRADYTELCRSCHRRLDVASYEPALAAGRAARSVL